MKKGPCTGYVQEPFYEECKSLALLFDSGFFYSFFGAYMLNFFMNSS